MNDISKDYFKWLCKLIDHGGKVKVYKKTLALLYEQDFYGTLQLDLPKFSLASLALQVRDLPIWHKWEDRLPYPTIP